MKVIFLDIDGVLNSEVFWTRQKQHIRKQLAIEAGRTKDEASALANMDPECVARILKIVKETGAEIVVSSTWRYDDCLNYKLRFMGIPHTYGITPWSRDRHRGSEIKEWLDEHPEVTHYVIIDDDNDMLEEQEPYLVQTSWYDGINDYDVEKAIKILNNQTMLNIDELIKESFKSQKFTELKVYRLLKSMIMNFKTQKNAPEYTEAVEISLIRKYIQQTEEAMAQYYEAGREAMVKECLEEIEVLRKLLPKEIDPQDVRSILAGWCARNSFLNANNDPEIPKKSMGMAIKAMKEVFPTADGKMISDVVKEFVV